MLRKLTILGLLSILGVAAIPLTGCQTTGNDVYGTRGEPTAQERAHYTDDKGFFHNDAWQRGTPLR